MAHDIDRIHAVSRDEQIRIIESVSRTGDMQAIRKAILLLNHPDMEIRGEAFGSLALNGNEISQVLIEALAHGEKNVRAFAALILANRGDHDSVGPLRRLTVDQSPMVRSCALGALGYLGAREAEAEIRGRFADKVLEVKKSALAAAIDVGLRITEREAAILSEGGDDELDRLAASARPRCGPSETP